ASPAPDRRVVRMSVDGPAFARSPPSSAILTVSFSSRTSTFRTAGLEFRSQTQPASVKTLTDTQALPEHGPAPSGAEPLRCGAGAAGGVLGGWAGAGRRASSTRGVGWEGAGREGSPVRGAGCGGAGRGASAVRRAGRDGAGFGGMSLPTSPPPPAARFAVTNDCAGSVLARPLPSGDRASRLT